MIRAPGEEVGRVRIASVPAGHVYVRHLDRVHASTVTRLTDPSGDDRRTPCFLDPAWWEHAPAAAAVDVLHVHFGFEYYDAAQLAAVCAAAHRRGVGVVHTCHDLRNPNHATADLHDRNLAVWMRHADEVVTLTPWARRVIERRYHRTLTVLPHPHVVPLDELTRRESLPRRRHADRVRIGLHFKSLRPNMFRGELLSAAVQVLEQEPADVRLRVDLHADVADPQGRCHDAELVRLAWDAAARSDSRVDLHVHHYLSEHELWDLIAGLEVFVLPYRFGTHSGLLEACRDLGTTVVAPDVGGYADQGAQHTFRVDRHGQLDAASFVAAVRAAVAAPRPAPVPVAVRRDQRDRLAHDHLVVYERARAAALARRASA
jgi:beta-1,4-mannosyltransferase